MPNFKSHLRFGTLLICLTAILPSLVSFYIDPINLSIQQVLLIVLVGLLGTLIPDIDHNLSIINNLVYSCLTVTTVAFTTHVFVNQGLFAALIESEGYFYGLMMTLGLTLLSMLIFYILWQGFEYLFGHRDELHSLLFLSLISLIIISIGYYPVKAVYGIDWAATMGLSLFFLIIGAAGHIGLDTVF